MTHDRIGAEIDRLQQILEEERRHLLAGRPGETAELAAGKLSAMEELERAFGSLEPGSVPPAYRAGMERIVNLAKENAVHFTAVRNGLRRAIGRLESPGDNVYVGSYTQSGDKVAFTDVTGRYQKKA